MRFAIYGRKSVFSDKSDSIDNQFRMCRDYIACRFSGEDNVVCTYSDEDFSGANADRPDLSRLLSDIRAGAVDALVVYQLDRLSRDVRDFSNIYALLEERRVMFISIKESIDTATPIGKAMMYVTVVFAQMERETIAARVTDNMIGLAKKGYWVGGKAPLGFERQQITVDGRRHVSLAVVPDQAAYVTRLFDTFLKGGFSLSGLETYFRQQGVKAPGGGFFSSTQLHQILTSPFCCAADPAAYDYYESKGCIMEDDRSVWDGSHGVMVYGRTSEKDKKHRAMPPEAWHVCCGYHLPFMSSEKWLAVQARFGINKFNKTSKYDPPLLKGVLRCTCGATCGVSRKKKQVGVSSWYYCRRRMREGSEACAGFPQIKCEILDNMVLDAFRTIAADRSEIDKYTAAADPQADTPDLRGLRSSISAAEAKIGRLTANLATCEDSAGAPYIRAEIDRLALEVAALKRELALSESASRSAADQAALRETHAAEIERLILGLDLFSASERNEIVRACVRECVWDGEELFLRL